jgi:hypothetical protein
MSYQDELMKDWNVERRIQALDIVACEYRLIAGYSQEELLEFAKTNNTRNLQVHHKSYPRRYTELNNLHLLILLCESCHKQTH